LIQKNFKIKLLIYFRKHLQQLLEAIKNCYHLWFACDANKAFKIKDENQNTFADIIGGGNQVIAPGSTHQSGSIYKVVEDVPIAFIPYAELEAILKPHDRSPKK